MAYSGHPGKVGGEQAAKNSNLSGGALGGGTGNSGGLQPAQKHHLDMKYPGASKKKNKSFDLTVGNIGTLVSKAFDLTNPAMAGLKMGVEAVTGVDLPTFDDRFTGQGPDVPSTGAGYADSGPKDDRKTPAEKVAEQRTVLKKNKSKLSKGFTLLAGAGGTLLGS